MLRVFAFLQNRLAEPVRRDDRGVTAVEYAILITVVGLALITTLTLFATQLGNFFSGFITKL
jgi:Flp pilus assembly pilin Flp